MNLKLCPCGKTPNGFNYDCGDGRKYGWFTPNCCDEWGFEARTNYKTGDVELQEIAVRRWNDLPRSAEARSND